VCRLEPRGKFHGHFENARPTTISGSTIPPAHSAGSTLLLSCALRPYQVCRVIVTMRQQFADNDPRCFPRSRSRTATHPAGSSAPVETSGSSVAGTRARLRSQPSDHRRSGLGLLPPYSEGRVYARSCQAHGCSRLTRPRPCRAGELLQELLMSLLFTLQLIHHSAGIILLKRRSDPSKCRHLNGDL
jgi:hypothetical protein